MKTDDIQSNEYRTSIDLTIVIVRKDSSPCLPPNSEDLIHHLKAKGLSIKASEPEINSRMVIEVDLDS